MKMGNNEEGKSAKRDKSSSPAPPDQANIHVYPDWAAMQAYYGPRMALPPYYNSAMASGHAPHPYMWGPPQPMMPPYGTPYAAVYSHGGVYAHPAVPIGSQPPGHGVPASPAAVTPLNVETPTKSTGNADRGLIKKLKGFDGLAMSIGNGHSKVESAEGGERRLSQSSETEGSTNGSDGNTTAGKKRSREGTPTIGGEIRTETRVNSLPTGEAKSVGSVISPSMSTALELRNSPVSAAKTNVQPCPVLPPETWIQNERELKRERRKQSNRESARRSRLRKQAETEELSHKVESLTSENLALKSEIHQMSEKSEKLRLENAALLEKLKNAELGHSQDIMLNNSDEPRGSAVSTENLLSRVDNSASVERKTAEDGDIYERTSNSGAKLHQLLSTSPRADAVAAG
ncbi:Common plant regulatory factor CPRF-1, putative [Ricinus communis]|uniref:Common plant regulatory factor CPRF-1, putative n=1 Tax=Ricinus communis TaxID=3988 RepID=B9RE16_RICCO|nr:Common plant regulatory factor CPRF-1, putative [Ricinus communis]